MYGLVVIKMEGGSEHDLRLLDTSSNDENTSKPSAETTTEKKTNNDENDMNKTSDNKVMQISIFQIRLIDNSV